MGMNRLRARLLHRERGRIKLWGIGASLALTGATVAAWSVLGGIGAGATSFSAHTSTVGACTTPTPTPTGGQAAVANNVAPASSCDPESTPSPTPKDGKGNDEGPADDCDKLADRSKPY